MKPSAAHLFVLLSLLVGACATPPAANPPSPSKTATPTPLVVADTPVATRAPTSPPPVTTPLARPTLVAQTLVAPTEPASTPPPASPTPGADNEPPIAQLRLPDGSLVSGELGSWCYGAACADIILGPLEQLPRLQLTQAGDELKLSLPTPHRFVYWRAQYGSSVDGYAPLDLLAEGGVPLPDPDEVQPTPASPAPELAIASFRAPPRGSWLLRVEISFAAGRGSAPYYWHAIVP